MNSRPVAAVAAAAVAALGCAVLAGWALDIRLLKSVLPGLVSMKPNTALAFVLAGLSLWLQARSAASGEWRRAARAAALIAALIGSLTLGEYITGLDLGIDQLLFEDGPTTAGAWPPGRMAPATAFGFLALGLALLVLNTETRRGRRPAQALALAAGALPLTGLLGYLLGAPSLSGLGSYVPMALHTTVGLVALTAGVMLARPDRGLMSLVTAKTAGGIVVRRLLPAVAAIPIAMAWLRLEGQRAGLYASEVGVALYALANVGILSVAIWWIARPLDRLDRSHAQAHQALAVAEARFRATFEQAAVGIAHVSLEGQFLRLNRKFCEIAGYSEAELLARTFQDITHPDDLNADLAQARELLAGEISTYSMEKRYLRRDGSLVWINLTGSVLREPSGAPVHYIAVIEDIGERKRAEAALRAKTNELDRYFTSSLDLLCIADAQGFFRRLNPEWIRTLGWPLADLEGHRFLDFVHPDDLEETLEAVTRLSQQREVLNFVNRYRCRDGTYRWLEWRAYPQGEEIYAVARDITERKRVENELVESNRFNQEIIASVHDVLFACDRDLRYLLWNRFAEESSGIPARDLLGRRVLEVFPNLRQHGVEPLLQRALAGEVVKTPDIPVGIPGTDQVVWTTGTLAPRRNAAGEIIGVIGMIHDITERKHADEALRQSQDQLRQAQKMEAVGRLAGGVAHDFNNLLGVIMGHSEMLLRGADPDDPGTRRLEQIHKGAERAASLTRQLLAFSRKQILDPKVISLNAIVEDTEKMLRRLIGEDVEMVVSLDRGLDLVRADPGQLEQVLMNLAVNARDAMPQGGRLEIETANVVLDQTVAQGHAGVSPGCYVMVAVGDTGLGMNAETKSRVFEPFFTTKEPGKGTGLGLSTVYGIVQQSGGQVTVDSEPGMGSRFKVYLPRVEEDATPAPTESSSEPIAAGSETILLVEDDASVREMISDTLRGAGYTVLEAAGAAEALAAIERRPGPVDLVLTDVVMPGLNGRDLARRLVSARPGMKVLFMSGYTDDAIVRHGVLEPGIAFLAKPFTSGALARKVREVLEGPGARPGGDLDLDPPAR